MKFKNIAAGLCAAVMALTMLPAMPIEVQAANIHATGSPFEKNLFHAIAANKKGKITFSRERYPGTGGIPLNKDQSVFVVASGENVTIYSKNGGGVFAPVDSSRLLAGNKGGGEPDLIIAKEVDLSGLDTSKVTNMSNMFLSSQAANLDVSGFDTSNVTTMEGMFFSSQAINLNLSNFNTSKVTNMGGMFSGSKVASINLSSFDTSKVTNFRQMFGNSVVKSLDVSNFNTSSATDMALMFAGVNVDNLDLRNFNTSKVTDMAMMFMMANIKNLNVSNFDTSNVLSMQNMFASFTTSNLNLSSFKTPKTTRTDNMFMGAKISNLDISGMNIPHVPLKDNMFYMANIPTVVCGTQQDIDAAKQTKNCSVTGFRLKHLPSHQLLAPEYSWGPDNQSCLALRRCSVNNCAYQSDIAIGTITNTVQKAPTCSAKGDTKYTASFKEPWAKSTSKIVTGNIPVKNDAHQWKETVYQWGQDGKSCTATRVCALNPNHKEVEKAVVTGKTKVAPTCTVKGTTTYTATFKNNWAKTQTTEKQDIPFIGHSMGATTYIWTPDGKSCTAVRECIHNGCEYTESFKGTMTSSVIKNPTCTEKGQTKYNAAFAVDWAVPQSKTMTDIAADGHKWQGAWSKDGSKHWHECSVCHAHKDEAVHVWDNGKITKQPTCTETGIKTYTCSVCKQTKTEIVKATGHAMGTVSYNWSPDGKSCTATRKCTHDGCAYTETSAGTIKSNVSKNPTCTDKGQTTYTATFDKDWAKIQTKTVTDIEADGHKWQEVWSKDGSKHWHECSVCHTHKDETAHAWDNGKITKQPTCTETGIKTYTCSVCGQTKTESVKATGHEMSVASYDWTPDGSSCTATRKCAHNSCSYTETSNGVIKSSISKNPSCTDKGQTTYTATFDKDWATAQTKVITDVEADGHTWQEEWSKDGVNHWHECSVCHTHKDETVHTWNAGEITKPATYEEAGVKTYTCTACGQQKTETIPMMQHELGEVTYNWTPDGKNCTAVKKCIHEGCDYSEQAVANVSSEVNKAATCGVAGDTKYTATFVESWASEQTKIVVGDIPATGNHVYDDEFDKECNVCGQKRSIDNGKGQEGKNNIPVVLTTVAHTFSVTVPTSLPISVAADGAISCADAASCKVVNNEEGPVDIKSVTLAGDNQWIIVPTSTAMESEAVNTKKLAMTVMGYDTNDGGLDTAAFQSQTINGNADFGIVYTAKLPTQTIETDKAPVANVVFTIGWHEAA